MTGPFDSLREYVSALEARGLLIRISEMDQDKYEAWLKNLVTIWRLHS